MYALDDLKNWKGNCGNITLYDQEQAIIFSSVENIFFVCFGYKNYLKLVFINLFQNDLDYE